jgi:hypoxanthine phosphoribosyltransferase
MHNVRTLIDANAIAEKVRELGAKITEEYRGRELVVVPVLKGSFMLAPICAARSICRSRWTSWVPQLRARRRAASCRSADLQRSIEGKTIVVEDIVDTGLTMTYDRQPRDAPAARSARVALHCPRTRARPTSTSSASDRRRFVVGYGLDRRALSNPVHRRRESVRERAPTDDEKMIAAGSTDPLHWYARAMSSHARAPRRRARGVRGRA